MPVCLRIDKGTETVDMATTDSYLLSKHESDEDSADSADCVIYGPSTEHDDPHEFTLDYYRGAGFHSVNRKYV